MLMGRARAMLIQAGIDSKGKGEFRCEVISTATKLDNYGEARKDKAPTHLILQQGCKIHEIHENLWRNGSGCHT